MGLYLRTIHETKLGILKALSRWKFLLIVDMILAAAWLMSKLQNIAHAFSYMSENIQNDNCSNKFTLIDQSNLH